MENLLYKNGYPFSDCLVETINECKKMIANDEACSIILDGKVGLGKSNNGVQILKVYQGSPIIYKYQYAIGGKDFLRKIKVCYEKGIKVIIYDEAGDFSSRSALSKPNRDLQRFFDICRALGILMIIILPHFKNLDKILIESAIPQVLVHISGRTGQEYNDFSLYSLDQMYYMKDRIMRRNIQPAMAYSVTSPCARGHCLRLSSKEAKELKDISNKGKLDLLPDSDEIVDDLFDYKGFSKELGKSTTWVRIKIKELGLKPKRIFERRNYYNKEALLLLERQ